MSTCPQAFLEWEQRSTDTVKFNKCYADLAGDLVAGLILSQIVYWHKPDKNGRPKMRVEREGELWLAKTRQDWWDECRATVKQAEKALKTLEKKGIIYSKIFKFNGFRTKHVRINWDIFLPALAAIAENPMLLKREHRSYQVRNIGPAKKEAPLTETTSRNYLPETTPKVSHLKRIEDSQSRERDLNLEESQDETSLTNSTDNSTGDRNSTARDSKTVPLFSEKRKNEYGFTYDDKGWIQVPTHDRYCLPRAMAIRRMQAILALEVVPNVAELAWDETGERLRRKGKQLGFYDLYADEFKWEDDAFREDGSLSLKALREYAYSMVDLSKESYNAMLEDLFIWSVQWCKEHDKNAVPILNQTSVIELFFIQDCEAFGIPI